MKLYRIKRSKIDKKGRGLYATCDIKEGTKIIDYVGKIITKTTKSYGEQYVDNSIVIKHGEEGVVDKVFISQTPDGYKLVKIKIRNQRIPEIGDKFVSRHGQKGTIGMMYAQEDMPFTKAILIYKPLTPPTLSLQYGMTMK